MRLKLPVLLAVLVVCAASVAHAEGVMDRARERGNLVAAAVPDQLPMAMRDTSGNLSGFDIAVAEEVGKRLGLPVHFVTPGWPTILAGQWGGKWDFAVASITPTPKRAELLDFPAIYRMDAAVVVVRKDDDRMQRPQDASGKTIGVRPKTTFERYLRQELTLDEVGGPLAYVIEKPKIVLLTGDENTLQALERKKVDAIVTNRALAEAAQKAGAPLRILPGFLYFEPVAVATAKGDLEFDGKIGEAIEAMRADGTLSALSTKWFGIDLGTIIP